MHKAMQNPPVHPVALPRAREVRPFEIDSPLHRVVPAEVSQERLAFHPQYAETMRLHQDAA